MTLLIDGFDSPIGRVHVVSDGRSLCALDFGDPAERLLPLLAARFPGAAIHDADDPLGLASRARAWFAGDLSALEDLPLDGGGTPFQRRVWAELRKIPRGTTTSYGALAARLGVPSACRAVGAANGRNPVAIAVPCHRVVGADGGLCGYAGGVERKRWLLAHERAVLGARAGDASRARAVRRGVAT
jgi:methylated-DNA-[protein]-cysteine S-methyltransferase